VFSFGCYDEAVHLKSYQLTQSIENTKLTAFLFLQIGFQGRSNRSGHSGLGRCTFRPELDHAFRWCTPYCNLRVVLHTVTVTYSLQLTRIIFIERSRVLLHVLHITTQR